MIRAQGVEQTQVRELIDVPNPTLGVLFFAVHLPGARLPRTVDVLFLMGINQYRGLAAKSITLQKKASAGRATEFMAKVLSALAAI